VTAPDGEAVVRRRVARAVLIDDRGRVLLFPYRDRRAPMDPGYCHLPGGGMEPGESPQDAVRRELREEVGIEAAQLGRVIHEVRGVTFRHEGRVFEQDEWHVVGWWQRGRLGATRGDDPEADSVAAHRWWSVEELDGSSDRVYPADLVHVVRSLAADQPRPASDP
jgi:8-oxo-dGTP pyrophosphatase MutT (NUDIX family)